MSGSQGRHRACRGRLEQATSQVDFEEEAIAGAAQPLRQRVSHPVTLPLAAPSVEIRTEEARGRLATEPGGSAGATVGTAVGRWTSVPD
jgi:hypothetical protein